MATNTYIVIPKKGLGVGIQQFAAHIETLSSESASVAQQLFKAAKLPQRSVLTTAGLLNETGLIIARGTDAEEKGRESHAPRVLEGLDIILMDDLDNVDIDRLGEHAIVKENIEVPGFEPITSTSSLCSDWHLQKINIDAARNKALTGRGVRIGILDTGIDASHPDFPNKHVSFAEFDTSGFMVSTSPRDSACHGTHVAGLAAGSTYGVAPDADLAVAAVLTTVTDRGNVGYLAQILAGYNWIAHSNHSGQVPQISQCPVINASLGGVGFNNYLYSSTQIVRQVPASLLVAAIGNAGRKGVNNHGSPGNYDIVLGVGATDNNDISADFSDWGQESGTGSLKPDLSSPGVAVCSAVPGGSHAPKSGTSMAAPIVAGTAALLVQRSPKLARNPSTLFTQLLRLVTSSPAMDPINISGKFNKIGAGRLDLTYI